MIVRLVKMTVRDAQVKEFKEFVMLVRAKILNFAGCQYLDILQDIHHNNIFFSYSHWDSEEDLENYRQSAFFKETWAKASLLFKEKPRAWSTEKL